MDQTTEDLIEKNKTKKEYICTTAELFLQKKERD